MFQLHLSDQQFNCLLKRDSYQRFDGSLWDTLNSNTKHEYIPRISYGWLYSSALTEFHHSILQLAIFTYISDYYDSHFINKIVEYIFVIKLLNLWSYVPYGLIHNMSELFPIMALCQANPNLTLARILNLSTSDRSFDNFILAVVTSPAFVILCMLIHHAFFSVTHILNRKSIS